MQVKAKFRCNAVELYTNDRYGNQRVKLTAVTPNGDKSNAEDLSFWKYTPSGSVEMTIDNPDASKLFEPGKSYYLTFESAD